MSYSSFFNQTSLSDLIKREALVDYDSVPAYLDKIHTVLNSVAGLKPGSSEYRDAIKEATTKVVQSGGAIPLSYVLNGWYDDTPCATLAANALKAINYYAQGSAGEDLAHLALEALAVIQDMTGDIQGARVLPILEFTQVDGGGFQSRVSTLQVCFAPSPTPLYSRGARLAAANEVLRNSDRAAHANLFPLLSTVDRLSQEMVELRRWATSAGASIHHLGQTVMALPSSSSGHYVSVPSLSYRGDFSTSTVSGLPGPTPANSPLDHSASGLTFDLVEDEHRLRDQIGEGAEWLLLEDLYEFSEHYLTPHDFIERVRSAMHTLSRFFFAAIEYEEIEDELGSGSGVNWSERPPRVLPQVVNDLGIPEIQMAVNVGETALKSYWVTTIVGFLLGGYSTPNQGNAKTHFPNFLPPYLVPYLKALENRKDPLGRPIEAITHVHEIPSIQRSKLPEVPLPRFVFDPRVHLKAELKEAEEHALLRERLGYSGCTTLVIPHDARLKSALTPEPFAQRIQEFSVRALEMTAGLLDLDGPEEMYARYAPKDRRSLDLDQIRKALTGNQGSLGSNPCVSSPNPACSESLDSITYPAYNPSCPDLPDLSQLTVRTPITSPFTPNHCVLTIRPKLPIRDDSMEALIQKRKAEALALLKEKGDNRLL